MNHYLKSLTVLEVDMVKFLLREFDKSIYLFDVMFGIKDKNEHIKIHKELCNKYQREADFATSFGKSCSILNMWAIALHNNLDYIFTLVCDHHIKKDCDKKIKYIREVLIPMSWFNLKLASDFNLEKSCYLPNIEREKKFWHASFNKEKAEEIIQKMINIVKEIIRISKE